METQERLLLFKQKNRWGMTALCAVLCAVAAPFMTLGLFMPQFVTLLPVLLLLMLGFVGPVSCVLCGVAFVGATGALFGLLGGFCAALMLIPAIVASTITVERRTGFYASAGITAGVAFASMGAILAVLTMAAGTDVVTALSGLMGRTFGAMGRAADPLLGMLSQMGMLSLPEGVTFEGLMQGASIPAEAREEMIGTLVYLLDAGLRLELPMQMTTGALACGVLGQAALRRGVLSRGMKVPYPPLRTWRLPKGWGRVLGGTLAALYIAAQLLPERLTVMAYVFYGLFTQLFALQGIAAICYALHRGGRGKGFAAAVFALGYFFVRPAAMIAGIADQAFDVTKRRAELDAEENPYDPRAKM